MESCDGQENKPAIATRKTVRLRGLDATNMPSPKRHRGKFGTIAPPSLAL
jgi:hypothetical protein